MQEYAVCSVCHAMLPIKRLDIEAHYQWHTILDLRWEPPKAESWLKTLWKRLR